MRKKTWIIQAKSFTSAWSKKISVWGQGAPKEFENLEKMK